jgi:hypothetical protein
MRKIFVGGSRRIGRLNADVKLRLQEFLAEKAEFLVGDANGADKAIQTFLHEQHYADVIVFCAGGECRNNVGKWKVEAVQPPHRTRDFEFFTAKDIAMAREAATALMLWDGESSGTLVNVARMVSASKPVLLYVSPQRKFVTVSSRKDLNRILHSCSEEVRERVGKYITEHAPKYAQRSMF